MREVAYTIRKVRIITEGGTWEFKVGGTICDPDEFDWDIIRIEAVEEQNE